MTGTSPQRGDNLKFEGGRTKRMKLLGSFTGGQYALKTTDNQHDGHGCNHSLLPAESDPEEIINGFDAKGKSHANESVTPEFCTHEFDPAICDSARVLGMDLKNG